MILEMPSFSGIHMHISQNTQDCNYRQPATLIDEDKLLLALLKRIY